MIERARNYQVEASNLVVSLSSTASGYRSLGASDFVFRIVFIR